MSKDEVAEEVGKIVKKYEGVYESRDIPYVCDDIKEELRILFKTIGLSPRKLDVTVNADGIFDIDIGDYVSILELN